MLDLGRFCARVTIGKVEAPEYGVEISEDGLSATCWIASEVGKNFTVSWTDKTAQNETSGTVRVDGAWARSKVNRRGQVHPIKVSAARTSVDKKRLLTFSKAQLTDDDAYLDQVSPALGTITININQVKALKGPVSASTRFAPYKTSMIHERAKKLSLHSVQYGAEKPARHNSVKSHTIRKGIASFTFKYRPLEYLQAEGIAPHPKHLEVAVEKDARGITKQEAMPDIIEIDDELPEPQTRMNALRQRKKNNKVKREHPPAFLPGEVIDLT